MVKLWTEEEGSMVQKLYLLYILVFGTLVVLCRNFWDGSEGSKC
jgi:hypothetical protein